MTIHGLAVIQQTASLDFPQGNGYHVGEILKQKCKPSDVSAEIKLYQEQKSRSIMQLTTTMTSL